MNRFELNYSNSEFYERHKGDEKALTNKPEQTPIE